MTSTTEEDTELRDLVAATLENSGVLGKIKAQLRANVYIALEEGNHDQECWTVFDSWTANLCVPLFEIYFQQGMYCLFF